MAHNNSYRTNKIREHIIASLLDTEAFSEHWTSRYLADRDYKSRAAFGYLGLAHGVSGIALTLLLHNEGRRDGEVDQAIHKYMSLGAMALTDLGQRAPSSPGIMSGLSGFGYTLAVANLQTGGYKNALAAIDSTILGATKGIAKILRDQSTTVWPALFDQIGGLSGMIPYLLIRNTGDAQAALRECVSAMAQRVCNGVEEQTGFLVPAGKQPSERHARRFPHGYLDLGLAHGVSGVLASLSLTVLDGHESTDVRRAIDALVSCLMRWSIRTPVGRCWPDMVNPQGPKGELEAARAAWCYGTPGIIAALYLAWQANAQAEARQAALEGLAHIASLNIEEMGILAPTFCHGAAGVLQILTQIARVEAPEALPASTSTLVAQLSRYLQDAFRPELPYGYCDWVEVTTGEYGLEERAGLLDGAAGVWLTLSKSTSPLWTRPLLIA